MSRITRRRFLVGGAATAAALTLRLRLDTRSGRAVSAPTLDPTAIPKYTTPLVVPPAMPMTAARTDADYYEISVRQFAQQILPPPYNPTPVWSYGSSNHPGTFNYPAFTIEARHGRAVRVKWANELVDSSGNYLPHLLPVDPTLHWANPPGGPTGRDRRPDFETTPGRYTGPVPIVTHVHGAHVPEDSDGYPEAWYLPQARNIPPAYARFGSLYTEFRAKAAARLHQGWTPGTSVFEYPNDQRATTLWYHDHSLGITRLNVYAGPAGFYLIRGGPDGQVEGKLPGPAPAEGDPAGVVYYEIPIAVQDRSFNANGSLFFPDSREFFDEYPGPYIPTTDVPPIWNPEFFGNTMVVNGRTWPVLHVEPRRYRFRFLNGCNSRFLDMKLVADPLVPRPATPSLPFWQIGTEGGFVPAPVQVGHLLMGLAERADVIVDFTGLAGQSLYLINEGPDEPFAGGEPFEDFEPADPATTGQVMKFAIDVPLAGVDDSTPPGELGLPPISPPPAVTNTRQLSLNELVSSAFDGPIAALLGTMSGGTPTPLAWADPVTETPALGATETWEIYNLTADAHPIHLHLVQFRVLNRQWLALDGEEVTIPVETVGDPMPPMPWETGFKDTVIAYPGQVTRITATFDRAGLYVWHCHIVDHEDNEMMRPLRVE